jgi:hypothetical protein
LEGDYQPAVGEFETSSILYGELQDIKNDLRVQSSVTRDYIERVYPDKQMEVWIMFETDIKGINHMEDMPCKPIHNYNYDWLLDNTDLINCIICRDKDVNQPVSEKFYCNAEAEKFYCNAEATGSSEDRCETHCIECIKYEKGMGSETFIAKWNKHIKGTSYPVAGDDKPTWLRITENLDVGGAAVMYDRDNPNVPLVYTIDEFHALGMAPSNKLDKFCMVHVMDNEFLSKHVIDTPSDKSNIDLYNMDLHERIDLEDNLVWVLRVPGGWVYESVNPSTSALASVFVPFNNEFQQ